MKRLYLATAALSLLVIAGCTPGNRNASGESMSQQVARHDRELNSIKSQIGQVEHLMPGQAEVWSQVQTMRQELNSVHGQIDDLQRNTASAVPQMQERLSRLELLMRRMAEQAGVDTSILDAPLAGGAAAPSYAAQTYGQDGAPGATSVTPPVETGATATSPADTQPAPAGSAITVDTNYDAAADSVSALYESGMQTFGEAKYNDALKIFRSLSANHPQHKLVSNALFWEGECYYKLKNYPNAAMAYQEVIEKYVGSPKYQAALLKQGMALYNAGKVDAAKERLNGLVSRYPTSQEAASAKTFLKNNP